MTVSADDLIEKIRTEAHRLAGAAGPSPTRPQAATGLAIPDLLTVKNQPVPADFPARTTYQAAEILAFADRSFVRAAYLAMLGREPDDAGWQHNTQALRDGDITKSGLIETLRDSPEGQQKGAVVHGLSTDRPGRRLYNLPVIGPWIRCLRLFLHLPATIHTVNRLNAGIEALQTRDGQAERDLRADFRAFKLSVERDMTGVMSETTRLMQDVAAIRAESKATAPFIDASNDRAAHHADRLDGVSNRLESLVTQFAAVGASIHGIRQIAARQQNELLALTRPFQSATPQNAAPLKRDADEVASAANDALYADLRDQLDGTPATVAARQRKYLPYLARAVIETGSDHALDLRAGRGDWLLAVQAAGYRGCGIEPNQILAARAAEAGLTVRHADPLEGLRSLPDNQFAFVSAAHLLQRLSPDRIVVLLDEIRRVLRPNGFVLLETANPAQLTAQKADFYRDPANRAPVHADTLLWLGDARGFVDSEIFFVNGASADMEPVTRRMMGRAPSDAPSNAPSDAPDYVWIARKTAGA